MVPGNRIRMQEDAARNLSPISDFKKAIRLLIPIRNISEVFRLYGPAKRRPAGLKAWELVHSLVYHLLLPVGTLSEHVKQLTGKKISDSGLSQRRTAIPWQVFESLMEACLKPKAKPRLHPEAFYKGLRLCGIDGTQFSVTNTPQNRSGLSKATSRRMKAAYAKVTTCVMVELGLRNPIGVAIGPAGESEMALSRQLIEKLPEKSLSIWDRLYGVGAVIGLILQIHQGGGREFIMRVKANLKAKIIEELPDGSALVEIKYGKDKLLVREIRGSVRRPKSTWSEVRMWTSLVDSRKYPAEELLKLYAQRWESEIYYKELKIDMRGGDLLQSHTPLTAAQEIAAWILAHAVLMDTRIKAAQIGGVEVLRVSFLKTLNWVQGLWQFLELGGDLIEPKNLEKLVKRVIKEISQSVTPKRRERSSPRAVRQPVVSWPRLTENSYQIGPTEYKMITVTS
jgi:hypothetical protein